MRLPRACYPFLETVGAHLTRGSAIPVAWHVTAANRRGTWLGPALGLLDRLAPAVPGGWTVLLLADRGLGSGWLWDALRHLGRHPLLRVRPEATYRPRSGKRARARCQRPVLPSASVNRMDTVPYGKVGHGWPRPRPPVVRRQLSHARAVPRRAPAARHRPVA